ncbi:MAG: T9SS type A sorting domain-containing protein [Saprospiraceae bacterium]|nr:T9SS type A sorting domain-containing protein [Saprospiraceae bacterium]
MVIKKVFLAVALVVTLIGAKIILREKANPHLGTIEKLYPNEDHFLLKQYPETTFHIRAYEKVMEEMLMFSKNQHARSTGSWVVQGPGNIGARANTVAIDPFNSQNILVGYSEGGLFRTRNGGTTWLPVFDEQTTLSIGDVVYDPINSDIVYAGTGDPNVSGYPFIGNGVYKSTDGGTTWRNIGLKETRIISQVRISKQDNNIIYVSAMGLPFEKNQHRGVFKSNNGGETWQQVLFVNDSTGICDLVVHPGNHNIVYAAGWNRIRNNKKSLVSGPDAKIYKSIDGGATWKTLKNGLPEDLSSRIGIDISASNPNILFACYTHPANFNLKGVYKSTDGGESWQSLIIGGDTGLEQGIYGGFGWYFGKIRINPNNSDDVFILGVDLYRTVDGGISWEAATPPWWSYEVHADKHDLIFQGSNMFLATDGGVYKANIDNARWEDIENIPTTQFYRVSYNPHSPELYYGGAQDNGTSGGNNLAINDWDRIYGGDGFQSLFHPQNKDIFYVETQNGDISVTSNGGIDFDAADAGIESSDPRNWDMPLMMSHHDPNVLYTGTNRIYRNEGGNTDINWKPISEDLTKPDSDFLRHNISAIHESKLNSDYIISGSSDGQLWVTKDKGSTWDKINTGLPLKYISSVSFSPVFENTIYCSFTGYKDNDNFPHIFKSDNLGKTWRPINGNIPPVAINNILVLPKPNDGDLIGGDLIVIATDAGVYFTNNGGGEWQRLGDNMPLVPVYDVDYNVINNEVIAGTFGRSILTFDLEQIGYGGLVNTNVIDEELSQFSLKSTLLTNDMRFIILNEKATNADYNIIDINGKVWQKGALSSNQSELCINDLPRGIYIISIKAHLSTYKKAIKFIKI